MSFIYGERDWMDPRAGARAAAAALAAHGGPRSPSDLSVDVIPGAGHYAFMDAPRDFAAAVAKQTSHLLPPAAAAALAAAAAEAERGGRGGGGGPGGDAEGLSAAIGSAWKRVASEGEVKKGGGRAT